VLRAGIADCLAALSADLAGAERSTAHFHRALARLDELRPTWRAHARLPVRDGAQPLHAIAALHRLHPLPDAPVQRRRLHAAVGQARRALARPHEPLPEGLPPELALVVRTGWSLRQPRPAAPSAMSDG
jgi:hypothetical protein